MSPGGTMAFLQSALVMAANGVARLDDCQSIWSEPLDGQLALQDKLIAETLLLVLLANRVPNLSPASREALRTICAHCAPRVYSPINLMLLGRHPQIAVTLGIGHLALKQMNYENKEFDNAIRRAFLTGQVSATERLPFRAMEVRWLEGLLFPERTLNFDDLLQASLLTANVHPLRMSQSDCYALTHALMYVTDFGRNSLPSLLSKHHLANLIDICLSGHLVRENLDITGQLAMSAIFVELPLSERVLYAWHFLAETWEEFGFLPCPTFNCDHYAELNSSEQRMAYAFKHTYHTTYVGAMLCCLLLSKPFLIDARQPATNSDKFGTSFLPILKRFNDCPSFKGLKGCHWTNTIRNAPISGHELRRLLVDGLIIHAAQEYDLLTLCNVLDDCRTGAVPPTEMLSEVVDFLSDQAIAGIFPAEVERRVLMAVRSH